MRCVTDLLGDLYRQNGIEFSSTGTDLSDNNPYRRPEIVDPPLTSIGRDQARALQPVRISTSDTRAQHNATAHKAYTFISLRCMSQQTKDLGVELVVVSPMVRATQTAIGAFAHLIDENRQVSEGNRLRGVRTFGELTSCVRSILQCHSLHTRARANQAAFTRATNA